MKRGSKQVLLIIPSIVIARGIENILNDLGEFEVAGIMPDIARNEETRLKNVECDIVIVDPQVFDYSSRLNARSYLSDYTSASVIALVSTPCDEASLKQYDDVISLYDEPSAIIRKLRGALSSHQDSQKGEGDELSSREKEILVCVAKGMLNKEIADQFNISIYTVITHRKNITRKTGIKTVAGLTVYALLNNLIDVNSFE